MDHIATSYDYAANGLTDQADHLERHAQKIEQKTDSVRRLAVSNAIDIGGELSIARDRLANRGDGTFRKWATERLTLSNTTISNMLNVYEKFGHLKGGELPTVGKTFDLSALYLLASDGCPEEVKQAAIEQAEAGERVTQKSVKQAIAAAKPAEQSNPPAANDRGPKPSSSPCKSSGGGSLPSPHEAPRQAEMDVGFAVEEDEEPGEFPGVQCIDVVLVRDVDDAVNDIHAKAGENFRGYIDADGTVWVPMVADGAPVDVWLEPEDFEEVKSLTDPELITEDDEGTEAPSEPHDFPKIKQVMLDAWADFDGPKADFLALARLALEEINEEYE